MYSKRDPSIAVEAGVEERGIAFVIQIRLGRQNNKGFWRCSRSGRGEEGYRYSAHCNYKPAGPVSEHETPPGALHPEDDPGQRGEDA